MTYDPRVYSLAFDLMEDARSAQPGAPVVEEQVRAAALRHRTAETLHRIADRVAAGTQRQEPAV